MRPPETVWPELLDALERAAGERDTICDRDGRDRDRAPAAAVHLPEAPGRIPAELVPRARAVLARLDDQELVLDAELERVRAELARLGRAPRNVAARHHGGFSARV